MTSTTTATGSLRLDRRAADGRVLATVDLDESIFGVAVNVPLIHQVVTAQLAARRSGTQNTKTRAEVAGGAAKPFRQKGTGNARQGTNRAPHFSGGGVALGPRPRKYDQKTPKKMIRAALSCALADRANEGGLRLVDSFGLSAPKTKDALAVLRAIDAEGRVLVVLSRDDEATARSLANLPHVVTLPSDQLTAFDVLCADVVVFTDATLPGAGTAAGVAAVDESEAPRATTRRRAASSSTARGADDSGTTSEQAATETSAAEPEASVASEASGASAPLTSEEDDSE